MRRNLRQAQLRISLVPDYPRGMIERDQFIEGRSAKDDLLAVSGPQPRASRGGWSLGWRGLACRIGRRLEERGLFEARRLGIVWVFHEEIIAVGSSLDNTFGIIGDSFTGSDKADRRRAVVGGAIGTSGMPLTASGR